MSKNKPKAINEISQSDWEKTPESVKRLVSNLVERIERLEQQYEELKAENQELKAENQLLKERLKQNSKNSSKPPSQYQGKGFKVKEKKRVQKKRGGQPGHEGHERKLYPIEECQRVEEY
ncbi:MAG: hypothetical protein HC920_01085 [Oscillatoriales cyanobacterium SM2_3_0]|nr:hypothetical protein [Oscillatoriales cyanobacterium SM2_3_0]